MKFKISVVSLGCDKNWSDSEYLVGLISEDSQNFTFVADPLEADVVIVNSCAFIKSAVEETLDVVFDLSDKGKKVVLAGCFPSRFRDLSETLKKELPEVFIFSPHGTFRSMLSALKLELLSEHEGKSEKKRGSDGSMFLRPSLGFSEAFLHPPKSFFVSYPHGYVKLTEGCNRRCTFCVIPKIRGKQVSRSISEIEKELSSAREQSLGEIVFVGQSTSDWEGDWLEFASVLEKYIEDIPWFRFLYLHPESLFGSGILELFEKRLVLPYFDISFQHNSKRILKLMGRRPIDVKKFVISLREKFPDGVLRSSFIVGFPGETEEEFESLLEFISEGYVDYPVVFPYSDEEDAPSFLLLNKVSDEEILRRYRIALEVSSRVVAESVERWIGSVENVIIEGNFDEGCVARGWFQAPEVDGRIRISGCGASVGEFVEIRIKGFFDEESLEGEFL